MSGGPWWLHVVEGAVLFYAVTYLCANLILIVAGARPALDQVRERSVLDLDLLDVNDSTLPRIAIIVPAFNEQTTIVDTARSLMAIDYPALELVIVNDGSTDSTVRAMREAFSMRRRDLPIRSDLETSPIRAIYQATGEAASRVDRCLLIDKVNGGKPDALNAGVLAARSPLVLTIDADCLVDPEALKQLVRQLQTDPDIIAMGGQVAVANECDVADGRVTRARVSGGLLPLCQTVEYLRAFSVMRTGFSRLDSLLILSGAFMLLRRDTLVESGGFLTGRSSSKLLAEYVGPVNTTICEDMELVVRLHRNQRERGGHGRVVHAPVPLVWTEVPPTWSSLSKQRRRWHRGMLEILSMHRAMFLDARFGRLGLFAFPYFVWFEMIGPWIEAVGLFLVPALGILGWLAPLHAALILGVALGAGILQSLAAVVVTTWMEPTSLGGHGMRSLLGADTWRDRLLLVAGCFLTEMGYRQMTVLWRVRATFDFLRGRKGWDKFERKGFGPGAAAILAMAVVCLLSTTGLAEETPESWEREATVVAGSEIREGGVVSWWTEAFAQWKNDTQRSHGLGAYWVDFDGRTDRGVIVSLAPPRFEWGGMGLEVRSAPTASFSPLWTVSGETEFRALPRATGSVRLRQTVYEDLSLNTLMVGTVVYLKWQAWWSHHITRQNSAFAGGTSDEIWGYASRLHVEVPFGTLRFGLQTGGESYLVESRSAPGKVRATVLGLTGAFHAGAWGDLLLGIDQRRPERGVRSVYLHTGLRRSF